jgi:hypothetical protein
LTHWLSLVLLQATAAVSLSPHLQDWKKDIERLDQREIHLARVFTNTATNELNLPDDAELRPVLVKLLSSEDFVRQLIAAHALNVNLDGKTRKVSLIVLNMARAADWNGQEDALIAHEFGHIWLHARGYQAFSMVGGMSCQALHAGDIVQHILIRDEMLRRGIDYKPFLIRTLETALTELEKGLASPSDATDPCRQMARIALWTDVSLGLTKSDWPRKDDFDAAMHKRFPVIEPRLRSILALIQDKDLQNIPVYTQCLRSTYYLLAPPPSR